jgi:3-phosphoshikimate 1-carboxyvinyltransferase
MKIKKLHKYNRFLTPPPDKSIMQRAVVFSLLFGGLEIENPSFCGDALSALSAATTLGATVDFRSSSLAIKSKSICDGKIDAGNSATAARLFLGFAVGKQLNLQIIGDKSLTRRSMKDTIAALEKCGASITSNNGFLPITNVPAPLFSAKVFLEKPSAQVKSAVIIAGIASGKAVEVVEKFPTRDHTERMLSYLSSPSSKGKSGLPVVSIKGDFSSAAYHIALALLVENGSVYIKNVSLNFFRIGMLSVLKKAGADIQIIEKGEESGEPFGDIVARHSLPKAFCIDEEILPQLIDEVPLLAVVACFCEGKSVFSGLSPLKNKESDRLKETCMLINGAGGKAETRGDSLIVYGQSQAEFLKKQDFVVESNDHRIVMSAAVLGCISGNIIIKNPQAAQISYTDFFDF